MELKKCYVYQLIPNLFLNKNFFGKIFSEKNFRGKSRFAGKKLLSFPQGKVSAFFQQIRLRAGENILF